MHQNRLSEYFKELETVDARKASEIEHNNLKQFQKHDIFSDLNQLKGFTMIDGKFYDLDGNLIKFESNEDGNFDNSCD